jgi:proline iminopeptidase
MFDLFPPLPSNAHGMMPVDDLHTIYWEECGNRHGVPMLFLHGGPGAGCAEMHRRFFDPRTWRVILFDQRGSGRSTPLGETRRNTMELLIRDIEQLRELLGISRWHVFGGSWGSTLALAYAETHPERCLSLTLRGIFLLQQREIDWFMQGLQTVFPDEWRTFASIIAPERRHDLLTAYGEIFDGSDTALKARATQLWLDYETNCSTLYPPPKVHLPLGEDHRSALPIMECHYFRHNRLTPDDRLLRDLHRIRDIPATIVQGRYDMICPIITANELHQAWPEARYVVVNDAGHSALEPGIRSAVVAAVEGLKR